MTNLAITAADVRIVLIEEMAADGPVNEAVSAGVPVRLDATTGKYTPGNGSTTTENQVKGIAVNTALLANQAISVLKRGILDVGDALSALNYGAPVYLSDTDGTLADSAGTVSTIIGYVVPAWGNTTPDKLLSVTITG